MKIWEEPIFYKWRKWFAWYPVKTISDEWVWLELVERKMTQAIIPNVVPSSWVIYRRLPTK